jgi:hypothetical protein
MFFRRALTGRGAVLHLIGYSHVLFAADTVW